MRVKVSEKNDDGTLLLKDGRRRKRGRGKREDITLSIEDFDAGLAAAQAAVEASDDAPSVDDSDNAAVDNALNPVAPTPVAAPREPAVTDVSGIHEAFDNLRRGETLALDNGKEVHVGGTYDLRYDGSIPISFKVLEKNPDGTVTLGFIKDGEVDPNQPRRTVDITELTAMVENPEDTPIQQFKQLNLAPENPSFGKDVDPLSLDAHVSTHEGVIFDNMGGEKVEVGGSYDLTIDGEPRHAKITSYDKNTGEVVLEVLPVADFSRDYNADAGTDCRPKCG